MKSGQKRYRCLPALAAAAVLLIGHGTLQAADAAANPSFSNTSDITSLTAQFGTFRQYQPTTPMNVTIYNRQVATPQSAMTYQPSQTTSLPPSSPPVTLQNIALNGIPAGGSGSLQLVLSTSQPALSTSYKIHFSSDTGPLPDHEPNPWTIFAFATVLPAGDFNNDRSVDPRDYVLWRKTSGQMAAGLAADGNVNGTVDIPDFDVWRSQFGKPPGSGSGTNLGSAVPEPTAIGIVLIALLSTVSARMWPMGRTA